MPVRRVGPDYEVTDTGFTTPCWIWLRAKDQDGYGVVREGKMYRAHRLYYERSSHGEVPSGLQLDHLCRQRGCVRPSHLEAVTPAENSRRGRVAKLTPSQAAEIRRLYATGGVTYFDLAEQYGVTFANIGYLVRGHTWVGVV